MPEPIGEVPAATTTHDVTQADTAVAVGSGSLPVLATPRLLAWLEATCCLAVDPMVPDGSTSVGTRATIDHLAPSPVGARVVCRASVTHRDGRLLRLEVVATQDDAVIGHGELSRVVVDERRFMARATGR